VHIKTGKYYACKVINKRLMEGREHMVRSPRLLLTSPSCLSFFNSAHARDQVRNEISVLKRISQNHPNIVTLVVRELSLEGRFPILTLSLSKGLL
jgi:calcium/calmodulin-dependent protein kinase I